MAQRWQHKTVPNSPTSVSQFLHPDGIPLHTKNIFLKQMKYVELTCLLGGSMLSWSVVVLL
jgi:hypothetical protein